MNDLLSLSPSSGYSSLHSYFSPNRASTQNASASGSSQSGAFLDETSSDAVSAFLPFKERQLNLAFCLSMGFLGWNFKATNFSTPLNINTYSINFSFVNLRQNLIKIILKKSCNLVQQTLMHLVNLKIDLKISLVNATCFNFLSCINNQDLLFLKTVMKPEREINVTVLALFKRKNKIRKNFYNRID
ncbi:hypothetical protein BpHYR1_033193 [Brachionus plicatilis]|uniref:Uncharacterized protein n=1 Tax=Brachionus plicatilis TaxID=10195 RepID=A0A3M7QNE7_BRAPC|nr:hypothetical protein BpHYR1_033193 [Brachionus plicatilis]